MWGRRSGGKCRTLKRTVQCRIGDTRSEHWKWQVRGRDSCDRRRKRSMAPVGCVFSSFRERRVSWGLVYLVPSDWLSFFRWAQRLTADGRCTSSTVCQNLDQPTMHRKPWAAQLRLDIVYRALPDLLNGFKGQWRIGVGRKISSLNVSETITGRDMEGRIRGKVGNHPHLRFPETVQPWLSTWLLRSECVKSCTRELTEGFRSLAVDGMSAQVRAKRTLIDPLAPRQWVSRSLLSKWLTEHNKEMAGHSTDCARRKAWWQTGNWNQMALNLL